MLTTRHDLAAEVSAALLLIAESEGRAVRQTFSEEISQRAKTQDPIALARASCEWFLEITSCQSKQDSS